MDRKPCCKKEGLRRGSWSRHEDRKLISFIKRNGGPGTWHSLPRNAGLRRCGKSCRLRWTNYLNPDIKRGNFSYDEQQKIIFLHTLFGNKWSFIASQIPKRTDNEIKNYCKSTLKKRLPRRTPDFYRSESDMKHTELRNHYAQWEYEAEVQLAKEAHVTFEGVRPTASTIWRTGSSLCAVDREPPSRRLKSDPELSAYQSLYFTNLAPNCQKFYQNRMQDLSPELPLNTCQYGQGSASSESEPSHGHSKCTEHCREDDIANSHTDHCVAESSSRCVSGMDINVSGDSCPQSIQEQHALLFEDGESDSGISKQSDASLFYGYRIEDGSFDPCIGNEKEEDLRKLESVCGLLDKFEVEQLLPPGDLDHYALELGMQTGVALQMENSQSFPSFRATESNADYDFVAPKTLDNMYWQTLSAHQL